jgi:hypothetical protein
MKGFDKRSSAYYNVIRKEEIIMALIQARLTNEEDQMVREYAKAKNISVSSLIRESILEKIEDEIDLRLYEEAMGEHIKNPQAISFGEAVKIING